MAESTERFLALDCVRGIASVGVLIFHCGLTLQQPWLCAHGALAVDIFFVMSGFVVDFAYGERLRARWPRKSFAAVRLVRLYPLYVVGIVLGLSIKLFEFAYQGRSEPTSALLLATLAGLLLIPLFSGSDRQVFPLNGPCWSLLVECLANGGYAAAPSCRSRYVVCVIGIAGAVLFTAALAGQPLLMGGTSRNLWIDVARGAFGFGLGVLMARAEKRGRLTTLNRWWAPPVTVILLSAMFKPRGPADAWFDLLAIMLISPAAVALAIGQSPSSDRLRRLYAGLGAMSYPLYIVHAPLLDLGDKLASSTSSPPPVSSSVAVWSAAGLSLVLAIVAARLLEPGLRRTLGRVRF